MPLQKQFLLNLVLTTCSWAISSTRGLPVGERPTFHEIRALGAWLYEQQGFEQEYIQGLMGHADVKMTEHYQAGHGDDEVVYTKVKADLKL